MKYTRKCQANICCCKLLTAQSTSTGFGWWEAVKRTLVGLLELMPHSQTVMVS